MNKSSSQKHKIHIYIKSLTTASNFIDTNTNSKEKIICKNFNSNKLSSQSVEKYNSFSTHYKAPAYRPLNIRFKSQSKQLPSPKLYKLEKKKRSSIQFSQNSLEDLLSQPIGKEIARRLTSIKVNMRKINESKPIPTKSVLSKLASRTKDRLIKCINIKYEGPSTNNKSIRLFSYPFHSKHTNEIKTEYPRHLQRCSSVTRYPLVRSHLFENRHDSSIVTMGAQLFEYRIAQLYEERNKIEKAFYRIQDHY